MGPTNFFSVLEGKDGEIEFGEVKPLTKEEKRKARFAALAAAEEEAKEKEVQQNWNPNRSHPNSRQSNNERDSKRQGEKIYGQGPRRNGEAVHQSNGYQQKHRAGNYYQHDNRQSGEYRKDNRVVDGVPSNDGYYQGNYRRNDGYQPNYRSNNEYYQGDYRGNGGYDYKRNYRSKGSQGEDNGYSYNDNSIEQVGYVGDNHSDAYEGEQSQIDGPRSEAGWVQMKGNGRRERGSNKGYYRNKSRFVEANEQPVNEGQDERQPWNGELVDEKDARDQVSKTSEDKEVKADENAVNADGSEVVNEASKEEAKPKQMKQNGDTINKHWSEMNADERKIARAKKAEERAKEIEEDKKLMTLEQFEKIRLEKKQALLEVLAASKKVDMDKDTMQPIHEKKEEEKAVEHTEKEQLNLKNNHGKNEKAAETSILKEFFNSSGGRKFERRGGQYEGRRFDGQKPRKGGQQRDQNKASNVVKLEDEKQFPVLGGLSA